MADEFKFPVGPDRLSAVRHDLRNPLGEIVGFAEMLIEEARERRVTELLEGLESIRHSAHCILADVNHALHPDKVGRHAPGLQALNTTVQQLSDRILRRSQELSDKCDELGHVSIADDLLRISGSARRLREIAPPALEGLVNLDLAGNGAGPDERAAAAETADPAPSASGGSILVVDDQEANRALLARRLRKQGYAVSLAENGKHALERLRSRRFDLVLLDIVMPEMDGMEVLRQVKADPQLAHIPVLMLSALDELTAVVQCIELGAADYLPKPFPPAILQARVQASLENKRMSDQLRKYTGWLFGRTLFTNAVAAPAGMMDLRRQERTVLFADIRGFTAWSERNTPEAAVAMLNRYFETAERLWADSPVIKSEYTGDEIMGIFPNADEAVRIARTFSAELGPQLREHGLDIGIGLHTGLVIEGLMGGAEVKAYRFVGDTVNTARRICSHAQAGQVLLSAATCAAMGAAIGGSPFEIAAKGKAGPVEVRSLACL